MLKKPMLAYATIVAVALLLTLSLAGGFGPLGGLTKETHAQAPALSPQEQASLKQAMDLSLAFQRAAEAVAPAVVNIVSTQRVEVPQRRRPQLRTPRGFEDFFDRFFEPSDPDQRFRERSGQGSGVIVRADGHILTNNHLVAGAHKVRVILANGAEYEAKVIGADKETDLAVIKIAGNGLTPARFGDSAALKVGQWVLALGNPFGLDHTVTAGIVSAKGRSGFGVAVYENFIQTDAAINPGNSGGPLVNLRGEVVGINTFIATRNGGYMGLGFAIPSDLAHGVMESILQRGTVVRGYLGITMYALDGDLAESFGYDSTDGVLIADVTEDGPAEKAGLRKDDIIIELDGKPMATRNQLLNTVATIAPDTAVELTIFRDGTQHKTRVTLGERPSLAELAAQQRESASDTFDDLGVSVRELTPQLAQELGTRARGGVVVTHVQQGSLAAGVGLQEDDIILDFGDTRIRSLDDFRRAMNAFDQNHGVRLRLQRGNSILYRMVK